MISEIKDAWEKMLGLMGTTKISERSGGDSPEEGFNSEAVNRIYFIEIHGNNCSLKLFRSGNEN